MEQKRIYFKSDFRIIEHSDNGYTLPFEFIYYTNDPARPWVASFDGTTYKGCELDDDTHLCIAFDNHVMGLGRLVVERHYFLDDIHYQTGICDEVIMPSPVVVEEDGVEKEIVLSFRGDDVLVAPSDVPPYWTRGPQGPQGERGPQGLRGEQGPKGDPSTADINLVGTVVTVTNNAGDETSLDIEDAIEDAVYNVVVTQEVVQIAVTVAADAPQGTTASGLVVNAYYNDADVPSAQTTTDANGMAVLRVPAGYKYKLAFPSQQGCKPIPDVVHTASIPQRSVEVEYEEYVVSDGEIVRVVVEQKTGDVLGRVAGVDIVVTYDGTATTYTTDATGTAQFIVPYGKQYTITAPHREDWYLHENRYVLNMTAEQTNRAVTFVYRSYESGLTIIAADGGEYTLEEWEAVVEAGTKHNSEAMLIKISTGQLAQNGGVFTIDIDMVRNRSQGTDTSWASQNVAFNSVPLNGNSTSAAYYYDGLTASRLVQQEGDERSIDTFAADRCLAMSRVIGAGTGAELSLPGFLGSVGQWNELWKNVVEIDDILLSTRPEGQYLMSTWTTNKLTITQSNAGFAWCWGTAASNYFKNYSFVVLPFFAY